MRNLKIPELLAPAGGWQHLRAAVQNGADAVYVGGPLFNARIKADNFGDDDMEKAICYAHDRDVRIYVTINTLIKDSELKKAFSYVNFLYGAGADAVILQDMGLARMIRKYLPDMDMHLSTQGTFYNKWALGSVRRMGFCRAVAAREMSLHEISELSRECHSKEDPCELEVFVHGALCMCYSGQCQMSRVLGGQGGRSGNRGVCAQPCRLPYIDENGKERYLLSPKDMCTIDIIPELCKAGIDSLKIEGRLKSPQYVAVVTSIYRKYLDMYKMTGKVRVEKRDNEKLMQIFNRGGFGTGYLAGNPKAGILSGKSPKNQGIYIGRVSGRSKDSPLVDVSTYGAASARSDAVSIGDGVEIRGKDVTGNVITYVRKLKNDVIRIGDIKGKVYIGDRVYKVTDKDLLSEAENSYSSDYVKKIPVNMEFSAEIGDFPVLKMSEAVPPYIHEKSPVSFVYAKAGYIAEKALNRPIDDKRIKAQLSKLGDTVFRACSITVDIGSDVSIPVSLINTMRRDAAESMLRQRRQYYEERKPLSEEDLSRIYQDELTSDGSEGYHLMQHVAGIHVYSISSVKRADDIIKSVRDKGMRIYVYIPLEIYMKENAGKDFLKKYKSYGVAVIPYILNISKGALDRYIEENFNKIAEAVKETGIMTGNLGWIERFAEAGIKVYGGYGLNAYNRQSIKAYGEIGADIMEWSHEDSDHYSGSIPLMITEHPITAKRFVDRKGEEYKVMKWYSGDKYLIFRNNNTDGAYTIPGVVMYLP